MLVFVLRLFVAYLFPQEYIPDNKSRERIVLTCAAPTTSKAERSYPVAFYGEGYEAIKAEITRRGGYLYSRIIRQGNRILDVDVSKKTNPASLRILCQNDQVFFCVLAKVDSEKVSCHWDNLHHFCLAEISNANISFLDMDVDVTHRCIRVSNQWASWTLSQYFEDRPLMQFFKVPKSLFRNHPYPRNGPEFPNIYENQQIQYHLESLVQNGHHAIFFATVPQGLRKTLCAFFLRDESIQCIHLCRRQSDEIYPAIDEFCPLTHYDSFLGFQVLDEAMLREIGIKVEFIPYSDLVRLLRKACPRRVASSPLTERKDIVWVFAPFFIKDVEDWLQLKALERQSTFQDSTIVRIDTDGIHGQKVEHKNLNPSDEYFLQSIHLQDPGIPESPDPLFGIF